MKIARNKNVLRKKNAMKTNSDYCQPLTRGRYPVYSVTRLGVKRKVLSNQIYEHHLSDLKLSYYLFVSLFEIDLF